MGPFDVGSYQDCSQPSLCARIYEFAMDRFKSRIHVRATRSHPLSKAKAEANRKKSRIRARIEHVFGAQQTSPGGRIVRTIGIIRARAKIGLQNLVYNIRRLVTLKRMAAA